MSRLPVTADATHPGKLCQQGVAPQRILLLCPDLHEVGGIGTVSRQALAALQDFGARAGSRGEVWSYGAAPVDAPRPRTPTWRLRYAYGHKTRAMLWGLQAGARHADDTLVVTMHLHLAPLALPLVSRGAKLAVFLHGIEAWTPLSGIRLAAMQQADFLVVNSRFTAERFRSSNPQCAAKEIRVCPLGVPQREFSSTPRAEGRPFALIVARLAAEERYKGHDLLLEIWRDVMALIPGARLVVVGDGNDRQRLETKARQLALADAVAFLGRVTDGELDRLYRDCRFLVMPSSEEGFGLAFVEAMRAGKPCIAAKGAAEEVVVDGETGLVVAPNDRDALWSAVTRLFADPALCERMGHAGRDRFVAQFTEAQFRGRFLTALGLRPDGGVS